MSIRENIIAGMPVYTAEGQVLGTVEDVRGTDLVVNHQPIPSSAVARVTGDGVYLQRTTGQRPSQHDTMTGHSVEDTETMRESAADIHLPVAGAETTILKGAIGTGAGAAAPDQGQPDVSDARYHRAREGFRRHFAQQSAARPAGQQVGPGLAQQGDEAAQRGTDASRTRTFEEVEQHYRSGYLAGDDARYASRAFEEVEPELQRDYERQYPQGDRWEHLRNQLRAGFDVARGS